MSQENLIKLACAICKKVKYHSTKNKKNRTRLVLRKFCNTCRKTQEHKETK